MSTVKCIFFSLFLCQFLNAQYNKFSSPYVHKSVIEAINVTDDIIKARTKNFEKKSEEKSLMFLREKKNISQLNNISNSVSDYIEKLKSLAGTEKILYKLVEESFFKELLFTQEGELTITGDSLKVKLDSLYFVNKKLNLRGFTHLKDFNNNHFKTDTDYYNEEGEIVDFFNHFFYDKSNYGIMMALNLLLLDVKTNQLLFFGTVMSY